MHLVLVDIVSIIESAWGRVKSIAPGKRQADALCEDVCTSIGYIIDSSAPTHMALVWKSLSKSDRRSRNALYDLDRFELPLHAVPYLRAVSLSLSDMGLESLSLEGKEPYDVMAFMAGKLPELEISFYTPDRRCWSLVTDLHRVVWPWADEAINQEITPTVFSAIFSKENIEPGHYLGYLLLLRLPGVGPAQASAIIRKHGDLGSIVDNMDDIGGRAGKSIRASLKSAGREAYYEIFPLKIASIGIRLSQLQVDFGRLAA